MVSCYDKYLNLGSLTVARVGSAEGRAFHNFLLKLARQLVPDQIETAIVGEEKSASGNELMIRSKRNNGKYDWHYVFTTKDSYVFIHSGNFEETRRAELNLKKVRRSLVSSMSMISASGPK